MNEIDKKLEKVKKYIKKTTCGNPDYVFKPVGFFNYEVSLIFCESVTSRDVINKSILDFFSEKTNYKIKTNNILDYLEKSIPVNKIVRAKTYDDLMYYLYSGFSIVAIDGCSEVLAIETKANLNSTITAAQNETVIKGPNDGFTENYQTNLGLIRKRLKTDKLCIEEKVVGKLSKTKVGILYISDIASKELVDYLNERISNIDIDSINDTNYVIDTICGNYTNVFPTYLSTERPDLVSFHLLEGKIAIAVENSHLIAILPIVFLELFKNTEDYYQAPVNASYTRIIRYVTFFLTILTPAIYIAMINYNHETLPTELLINFSIQRDGVPLPSILEALLMLLTFEILKETDARIPSIVGSSLSIVGALVLGDAAVTAGIVSPIMVIVIAITSISGFILSYLDVMNGVRWWRLLFLMFSAVAGMIGVIIGGLIFFINLSSIKALGVPYLSPISPLSLKDIPKTLYIGKRAKFLRRISLFANNNNIKRGEDSHK